MTAGCRFAYVQARVQARFAGLPTEAEWQRLAAARTLSSFLEEARIGPMRGWIKGFSGQSDSDDLEVGVRVLFRDTVHAVAGWMPPAWRDTVLWTRWLPLLPLLDHLARGGPMPPWPRRDPDLGRLLGQDGALDPKRFKRAGAAALVETSAEPASAWAVEWYRRRPPIGRGVGRSLDALEKLLRDHKAAFRQVEPAAAWGLRRDLRARLRLRFHQLSLQPAAPLVFLILTALDLERLRAALLSRALFPSGEGAS